jgi:hypothetical protein
MPKHVPKVSKVDSLDFKKIKHDRIFLFLGGRNTGKTTMIHDVVSRLRHLFDMGFAMCGSKESYDNCCRFLPQRLVHKHYDDELTKRFYDTCSEIVDGNKVRHVLCIDDDLFSDKRYLHNPSQTPLFVNGRHPHTARIICCQFTMFIPTQFRGNIDYIFALREPDLKNRQRLHENFFGCLGNFQQFEQVFEKVTANYGCLVLDKTEPSGNINEMIKFHRANLKNPEFKLGNPLFFKLSDVVEEENRREILRKKIMGSMNTITITT